MTRSTYLALLCGALLGGCGSGKATPPTGIVADAGKSDAGDGKRRLAAIGGKTLDALSSEEAVIVCEEDARQTDFCAQAGLTSTSASVCEDTVRKCRAAGDGGAPEVSCRGVESGPVGSCRVTVDDYFACVSAWNATQRCDNAGMLIETPAACTKVALDCPKLATGFFQAGTAMACASDAGSAPSAPASDDIVGDDGCRPVPARFLVLGDSIAACCCLAAPETDSCAAFQIADYLRATWAPGVVMESHAVAGAVTGDLPGQAHEVSGGPGHVLVWLWAIGNDITIALKRGQTLDYASLDAAWAEVFGYFTDTSRFPDGVTFLLNTQYSPFDECPAAWGPGSVNGAAEQTLQEANRRLFLDVAEQRPDTLAIDQYPDWLGHGEFANVRGCPHCSADNTSWMGFGFHPNATGYTHIAAKWKVALDRMYGPSCHGG